MIIAGYILLGISIFLMLVMIAMPTSVIIVLSFLVGLTMLFIIPGIVFLSVGYRIRDRRNTSKSPALHCPRCGKHVLESYVCCPHCGIKIVIEEKEKFCSKCGKELNAKHQFCPYCGSKK